MNGKGWIVFSLIVLGLSFVSTGSAEVPPISDPASETPFACLVLMDMGVEEWSRICPSSETGEFTGTIVESPCTLCNGVVDVGIEVFESSPEAEYAFGTPNGLYRGWPVIDADSYCTDPHPIHGHFDCIDSVLALVEQCILSIDVICTTTVPVFPDSHLCLDDLLEKAHARGLISSQDNPTPTPTMVNERSDINEDNVVDDKDLMILQSDWHKSKDP